MRRLRVACGMDVLERHGDELRPSAALEVDALQVRLAARARDYAQVLASEGALLGGLTVEEGGALERWLEAARQEFESLWARARAGELSRLEEAGEIQAALALSEVWVRREPESEEAGRAVIRLHALLGNRTAALAAFERLQRALERGLDARPSPETIALARTVGRGARLPAVTERSGSRPLPPERAAASGARGARGGLARARGGLGRGPAARDRRLSRRGEDTAGGRLRRVAGPLALHRLARR